MESVKKVVRNLIIFIFLIIITFSLILKNQNMKELRSIILNIDLKYFIIGFLAMSLYIILESINIKSILKTLGIKVSFIKTIRYTLTGFFFSGITPAASGGQPMEIFFMHKDGIPISKSSIALLVELISFQIITISSCIIGAIINPELLSHGVIYLFIAGITLNSIVLSTMLICFISEKTARKLVNIFLEILKFFHYKKLEEKKEEINNTISNYAESAKIIKANKSIIIKSIFIVFFQVYFYYSIPFWIYKSLGLNTLGILRFISIQALLFCSVSSIPLPGSVGVSESAFISIYSTIFGEKLLSTATILNRLDNFYLMVIIGLLVTIYGAIKVKRMEKARTSI